MFSFVFASAVACAKQAEGERCDLLSGANDCEDGLICISLDERNQGVGAVCCPSEGDSNNPICKGNSVDLNGDAGEDTTVNTPDAAVFDASTESDGAASETPDANTVLGDASVLDASAGDASTFPDAASDSSADSGLSSGSSDQSSGSDVSSSNVSSSDVSATETATSDSASSSEAMSSSADASVDASADAG